MAEDVGEGVGVVQGVGVVEGVGVRVVKGEGEGACMGECG